MIKTIVILAAMDTKWEEAEFLKKEIERRGFRALLLDVGMKGQPGISADISRTDVVNASGHDMKAFMVQGGNDRERLMSIMVNGAIKKLKDLISTSEVDGVVCVGGITGTRMGTSIMKSLPFGMPKVAVSSTASLKGFSSRYIGTQDITLIHSVVEFGPNDLLRNVLARAAGAVCGMVEGAEYYPIPAQGMKHLIAMTTWGPSEVCGTSVRQNLEAKGYQVVSFPSNGTGDRAMEEIIERQGVFEAVIELAPGGIGEELLGFTRAAGASRLEAAGKRGILQIIAPSGVNYGSPLKSKYKPEYESRKKHAYDALRTFIRLSHEELAMVAQVMAKKLNQSAGEVKVLIPLGGWSSIDRRGTDFYDGEADKVFVNELRLHLKKDIELKMIDADLNTVEFAQAISNFF